MPAVILRVEKFFVIIVYINFNGLPLPIRAQMGQGPWISQFLDFFTQAKFGWNLLSGSRKEAINVQSSCWQSINDDEQKQIAVGHLSDSGLTNKISWVTQVT